MPNPNAAGNIPLDQELTGVLTVRKGDIQRNPRRGETYSITVKVSDGFEVLRARVHTVSRPSHVPAGFVLYFKTSRRQVQSNFQEMTANNFEDFLTSRWAKITTQEVAKWTEDGLNAHEFPVFDFLYTHQINKPNQKIEFNELPSAGLQRQDDGFNSMTIKIVLRGEQLKGTT